MQDYIGPVWPPPIDTSSVDAEMPSKKVKAGRRHARIQGSFLAGFLTPLAIDLVFFSTGFATLAEIHYMAVKPVQWYLYGYGLETLILMVLPNFLALAGVFFAHKTMRANPWDFSLGMACSIGLVLLIANYISS